MEIVQTLAVILDSTIRLSVPLLCAAMAGLWSERAGVVDIGLEGKMLIAAFASAVIAYQSGSAWAGLGAGICPPPEEFAREWALEHRFEPAMDKTTRDARYARWKRAVAATMAA